MASKEQLKQISEKLAALLRDLIETGNWEASLFLRTAYKRFKELHDEAVKLSKKFDRVSGPSADKLHRDKLKQGYILVYVSIYQSDPLNMIKWENTLKTIREYSITRPIYSSKAHVEEAIRSKQGSFNEGYVSVYIKKEDVIPPYAGKKVEDRWGHELLTLRDGSLLPINILEFVHNDRKYEFLNRKLVLKSSNS